MVKFSVIIPTYNRELTLLRAIESVAGQSFPHWELIIVDDGSSDSSPQILKDLQQSWDQPQKVKVLQQDNAGVSSARNYGVKSAQFQWLAFLDSDDEWLENKLELQAKAIEAQPHTPLIHGEEIWIRNGVRVNQMKKHKKYGGRVFSQCLPLCCISPSASVIDKSIYNKFNGFREDYPACEDYDLWLKISAEHEVTFIETPLIKKYGGHTDQLSRKFIAMDYWRIKSMADHLDNPHISDSERQVLVKTLRKKCEILIKGYLKHNNLENLKEIEDILNKAPTL